MNYINPHYYQPYKVNIIKGPHPVYFSLILLVVSKSSKQSHLSNAAGPQTRTEKTYLKGKPAFSSISKAAVNKQHFIEKDNSSGNY